VLRTLAGGGLQETKDELESWGCALRRKMGGGGGGEKGNMDNSKAAFYGNKPGTSVKVLNHLFKIKRRVSTSKAVS